MPSTAMPRPWPPSRRSGRATTAGRRVAANGMQPVKLVYADGGQHQSFRQALSGDAGQGGSLAVDAGARKRLGDISRPEACPPGPRRSSSGRMARRDRDPRRHSPIPRRDRREALSLRQHPPGRRGRQRLQRLSRRARRKATGAPCSIAFEECSAAERERRRGRSRGARLTRGHVPSGSTRTRGAT